MAKLTLGRDEIRRMLFYYPLLTKQLQFERAELSVAKNVRAKIFRGGTNFYKKLFGRPKFSVKNWSRDQNFQDKNSGRPVIVINDTV